MDPALDRQFTALFALEYPTLVRALTLASGDAEAAADAVQAAFLQAHVHWRRVSRYENPATWVRRAAINRLADHRRGDRRRARFVEGATRRANALGEAPGTASQVPDLRDLDLRRALRDLPAGQRLAVALHYLSDLPIAEVADALGIAPGTVKSQLFDARRALARHAALIAEETPDGR